MGVAGGQPIISIGMLCYNEGEGIERVLTDALDQDVFTDHEVELVVVPNGCTDDTAAIARRVLAAVGDRMPSTVSLRVHELTDAGKANAWNVFVHELSRPDADILVLMDADIRIHGPSGLSGLIAELARHQGADLFNSRPVKDLAASADLTLKERLILRGGGTLAGVSGVCGQLYAARAAVLRAVYLPRGLPVEDGFLGGVLTTDMFRRPVDTSKCRYSGSVSHSYESERDVAGLVHHQGRIVVGASINAHLFGFLEGLNDEAPKSDILRDRDQSEPGWIEAMIAANIASGARPPVHRKVLTKRMRKWMKAPIKRKLATGPAVAAGLVLDAIVYRNARARMVAGKGLGHW